MLCIVCLAWIFVVVAVVNKNNRKNIFNIPKKHIYFFIFGMTFYI